MENPLLETNKEPLKKHFDALSHFLERQEAGEVFSYTDIVYFINRQEGFRPRAPRIMKGIRELQERGMVERVDEARFKLVTKPEKE